MEQLDQRHWIDTVAQLAKVLQLEQTAGHVVFGDLEVVSSLAIRELRVTFTGLGIDEVRHQVASIATEECVAK